MFTTFRYLLAAKFAFATAPPTPHSHSLLYMGHAPSATGLAQPQPQGAWPCGSGLPNAGVVRMGEPNPCMPSMGGGALSSSLGAVAGDRVGAATTASLSGSDSFSASVLSGFSVALAGGFFFLAAFFLGGVALRRELGGASARLEICWPSAFVPAVASLGAGGMVARDDGRGDQHVDENSLSEIGEVDGKMWLYTATELPGELPGELR